MNHKDINDQINKKAKKIATTIGSVALVGTIILVGCTKVGVFRGKDAEAPVNPQPETTTISPVASELVLTEDFDINDPAAVTKRAQDIYDLSEKQISVLDIQNLIYIINEKYDGIIYPDTKKSDEEKFGYLQYLALALSKILDDYLAKPVETMNQIYDGNVNNSVSTVPTRAIFSFMFMSQGNEAKQDGTANQNDKETKSDKDIAIDLAKVCLEQLDNISDNKLEAMHITADTYYVIYVEAKKHEPTGYKYAVLEDFAAKNPLFTSSLNKEQAEDLDGALGLVATLKNGMFSSAAENLDITEMIKEDQKNGDFGKHITKPGEEFVASDKKDAESRVEAESPTNKNEEPVVVDQGGKPASGSDGKQEEVNEVTTEERTSEFVVSVPNEGISEVVVPGGEVVAENTNEPVTEPSTTKAMPSTVEPSTTKPYTVATSAPKPEETITYVDSEDIPVMSEEDYFGEATPEDINDYRKSLVK